MVRSTVQTTAIEKTVCYISQEEGTCYTTGCCTGKHCVHQEAERGETAGNSFYCGFLVQGTGDLGYAGLGLASLNNFSVL